MALGRLIPNTRLYVHEGILAKKENLGLKAILFS